MTRSWLPAALLAAAACGAESPTHPSGNDIAVLAGAGDIGLCGSGGAMATGRLLDTTLGTVFALGDLAYPSGTAEQFRDCYIPYWGWHKARTRPAPGNHEYETPGAAPYYAYFGDNAGPAGRGYYRYTLGTWNVYSLNSVTVGSQAASQVAWLSGELARETTTCSVAYFHHPLFSSGPHGQNPPQTVVREFWRLLYEAGVDVVISAHEHFYERLAPQDPNGRPDSTYGIRQFIAGTGGATLTHVVRRVAQSEVVFSTFGILRLSLDPGSYRWEFVSAQGAGVLDSGTALCHGKPGS